MLRSMILLLLLIPSLVFAEDFVAGKDYEVLDNLNTNPSKAVAKVSVIEFFSYGCPWCYRIEAGVNQWQTTQGAHVQLKRVPVVFNNDWVYYAKAYYAANLLGKNAVLTPVLFKAIQTDKKPLASTQAMVDFFIAQGVDKEVAESAFNNSTTVDMKVRESNVLMGRMHINAVPAFVVAHKYKTDLKMAQNEQRLFQIMDYLVKKAKE